MKPLDDQQLIYKKKMFLYTEKMFLQQLNVMKESPSKRKKRKKVSMSTTDSLYYFQMTKQCRFINTIQIINAGKQSQ